MAKDNVIVIGLGEVGRPLLELLRGNHNVIGVDIDPVATDGECAVLHICYPFNDRFVDTTVRYIEKYAPQLTIINSTVMPGTTRAVYCRTQRPIAYSPIRGKHFKMKHDMMHYTKFTGGIDREAGLRAEAHFQSIGMRTKVVSSPETAELAKLAETTYFGLQIAWAQEIERYCNQVKADYDEAVSFFEEVPFLPSVKYVPGVIGGHCVLPNIQILLRMFDSDLLNAIVSSNDMKKEMELLQAEVGISRAS